MVVGGVSQGIKRALYEVESQVNTLPSHSLSLKNSLSRFPYTPFRIRYCLYRKNPIICFCDLHPKTKIAHDTASKSSFIDL